MASLGDHDKGAQTFVVSASDFSSPPLSGRTSIHNGPYAPLQLSKADLAEGPRFARLRAMKEAQYPPTPPRDQRELGSGDWPWLRFVIANLLCIVLLAWTVVLVPVPIYIARASEFGNTKRTVYTTCITVLASCITLYLVGHIRSEWLSTIDLKLPTHAAPTTIEALNRRWRTALGISSLQERRSEKKTWLMQSSLVFTALLTSALVAAMTPNNDLQPVSLPFGLPTGDASGCTTVVNGSSYSSQLEQFANKTSWPLPDGQRFVVLESATCPAGQILGLMGQLNDVAPDRYVYSTQGTAIHSSAIGSPQALVTYDAQDSTEGSVVGGTANTPQFKANYTTPLQAATDAVGVDLMNTRQCVPVLSSNPVSCRARANVTILDPNHLKIDNGAKCNLTAAYSFNLTSTNSQALKAFVCPGDTIGTGTALFGGINAYGLGLAGAVADVSFVDNLLLQTLDFSPDGSKASQSLTYGVACDFDVTKSITWRYATLDVEFSPSPDVPFSRMLYANESCEPLHDVTTQYAAMAVSGFAPPLQQFTPDATQLSGLTYHVLAHAGVPSIPNTNNFARAGPWAFKESQNALEDVLGLIAGLAMSQVPQYDTTTLFTSGGMLNVPMFQQQGSANAQVIRIGPGKPWALIYAIPPLLAWGFVIWLRIRVRKGQPAYRSSYMTDLIDFGRSTSGYSD